MSGGTNTPVNDGQNAKPTLEFMVQPTTTQGSVTKNEDPKSLVQFFHCSLVLNHLTLHVSVTQRTIRNT